MNRIPEPEVMDGKEQSEAYALADFQSVNADFVAQMNKTFPLKECKTAIDLGCGPAEIPIMTLRKHPHLRITAVDGSSEMLKWAAKRIEKHNVKGLSLVHKTLPLPAPPVPFDLIFSNSLLHHLHDPSMLWSEVSRQGGKGTRVYIMDLCRPESEERARQIVETYASDEPAILKHDFFFSLRAAFRPDELEVQLMEAGLARLTVEQVTDRHIVVKGEL